MVITSLNLYEFSMANNKEMGVLIDKNDPVDTQVFDDALKEVDYINQTSQRFELSAPKPSYSTKTDSKSRENKPSSIQADKPNGYCIRSGVEIPFNIEKPMCYDAYKAWSKYSDPDYPEKFCHFSGEPSNGETSVSKQS
jgi:hypothetical protein